MKKNNNKYIIELVIMLVYMVISFALLNASQGSSKYLVYKLFEMGNPTISSILEAPTIIISLIFLSPYVCLPIYVFLCVIEGFKNSKDKSILYIMIFLTVAFLVLFYYTSKKNVTERPDHRCSQAYDCKCPDDLNKLCECKLSIDDENEIIETIKCIQTQKNN